MKAAGRMLIAAVLLLSPGCVKQPDWIESTLVTVDVTGVWEGTLFVPRKSSPIQGPIRLELVQEGPQVRGTIHLSAIRGDDVSGPLEGRVGGDVLYFRLRPPTRAMIAGEFTVSGDEMEGTLYGGQVFQEKVQMLVRRVDLPSPPQR